MFSRKINLDFEKLKFYYCILFLSFLMARLINLYSLLPTKFDSAIFSFIALVGFFITIINVFKDKIKHQNKCLILFWLAILISSIANYKYGIFENVKELIWRFITFFLIFPYKESKKNLIQTIKKLVVIFCFIVSYISIVVYIFQINYYIDLQVFNGLSRVDPFRFGFIENRLFGLYSNPNSGATTALLSVIFSFEFLSEKFISKFYYNFNFISIILQLIYIILSGSRVTIITMIILIFFICWCIFQKKIKYIKKFKDNNYLFNITISIILSIIFCILFYFFIKILREFLSFLPPLVSRITGINKTLVYKLNIDRIDIKSSKDISNLRFNIWLSAIEIFKKTWLFGTSPRNLVVYAVKNLPNTFISKSKYATIHNIYLGIFTYTGIVGGICFYVFLIKILLKIFNNLVKFIENIYLINTKNRTIIFSLISVLIFGVFEPDIVFLNNVVNFSFWIFLGHFLN